MAGDCCDNACCNCLWRYYSPFVRTCGVVVAAGLWAIGITQVSGELFYIYIIFAALCVSILELLIFVEPCCEKCCRTEGTCHHLWEYMSWLDNWKRAIVYIFLSVFCYIKYRLIWAVVSGAILDALAILYILRTYRMRPAPSTLEEGGGGNGASSSPSKNYGRFKNDQAKTQMQSPVSSAPSSESAKLSKKEEQRLADEARYPGGVVPNPFEEERKDEDVDPEGDAGLTRYPP